MRSTSAVSMTGAMPTHDMEQPQTAESWRSMPTKAKEWFQKVESGEIENPYELEHSNEPEGYSF